MHLKHPGFIYSVCGSFTKHKERMQKIKETGDSRNFQHNIAYGDFKDLHRRTTSDEVLRGKAFNTAETQKCDGL